MTRKEFDVQKALGLAGEYELIIDIEPLVSVKAIKDAVARHAFTSRCFEIMYFDSTKDPVYSMSYATLKFEVKCVHEITQLIIKDLPHSLTIRIIPRNYSRL